MAKKIKETTSDVSQESLALMGIDYVNKKDAIKELTNQCAELRTSLEEAVETKGKVDAKGSKLLVIPHADVEVHLKQTLRSSSVLRAEAFEVIKELGLEEECVENVPTIREDVVERLYDSGKISDKDLQRIFAEKETYAFSVSLKAKYE